MMGVGVGGGGVGLGVVVKVAVGGGGAAVGVLVAGDGAVGVADGVLVGGGDIGVGDGVNVITSAGTVGLGVITTTSSGGNSCIASNKAATTVSTTIINVPMAIATRCQGEVEPFPLDEGSKDTWLPSFPHYFNVGQTSQSLDQGGGCRFLARGRQTARKWAIENERWSHSQSHSPPRPCRHGPQPTT